MDSSTRPSRRRRRLLIGGLIATTSIGGIVAVPLTAGAQHSADTSPKTTLEERKVGQYGEVLANSAGRSLYVLSTESKAKLHCTSKACLVNWPPLLVAKNATITFGRGVKGKISHVARGSKWQVTYNGWPVYTFLGDSGPGQSNGEKIHAFGGTWYLVHAAARTNATTPVKTVSGGGGSTTTTTYAW
ncbi:MAG: hypothetical protein ACLQNG_15600 [Acidimicrobiales bacterium]|jgi:predicted lipoprotein with Yx(FWY)xxD motif